MLERCIVKKKMYICGVRLEKWSDIVKRFLLYPETEIANFKQKDRDNVNAHSVLYMSVQPMLYIFCIYVAAWDNCFFIHFCKAFGDARFSMKKTMLTLFLCPSIFAD